MFKENGVGLDLALTPVVIAFLSTLIGTGAIRRRIADGRVVVDPGARAHPVLHLLPKGVFARSTLMALASDLLLGLPVRFLLEASLIGVLSPPLAGPRR